MYRVMCSTEICSTNGFRWSVPVLVFLRAIIVRRGVSKAHLVFHRELVALAFDPRSIDEDTCVCLESREGDADVIVDLVYLTDGACILELGRGFLLDSCRRRSTVHDRSVACFVASTRVLDRSVLLVFSRRLSYVDPCFSLRSKHAPSTMQSFPLTPTAVVPFRTASSAYST